MKKAKILFPILLSAVSIGLFTGAFTVQKHNDKAMMVKADPAIATFSGFAGNWNPASTVGDNQRYILTFAEDLGENNATNFCSEIGDHFQINGESLKSISTSLRIGHNNQGSKLLFIEFPTAKIVASDDYPTPIFHIDEGTPFQNYLLPELTFTIDTSTYSMSKVVELTFQSFNNNINYAPVPDGVTATEGGAPTNGGMVRIAFTSSELDGNTSSFLYHTSDWGKNVFINGTPLSEVDGAIVGSYFARLYVFVPTAYLTFTNPASNTIRSTLYVKNTLFGNCILPDMAFYWSGTVGTINGWTQQTDPLGTATQKTTSPGHIRWNNTDSGNYSGHKGMLLEYNENLALRGAYSEGGLDKVNLVNYGSFNVATNIKINGVALKDISGSEVFYKMTGMLWVYAPGMGAKGNVLDFAGVRVLDKYLPDQHYVFDTSWAMTDEDLMGNVNIFVKTYMHMDANVTGQCVGYYPLAKTAYASLSANAKMVFANNVTFEDACERLVAWATYHNETFDGSTITANSNGLILFGGVDSDSNTMLVVLIVSTVSILSILVACIALKRKHKEY